MSGGRISDSYSGGPKTFLLSSHHVICLPDSCRISELRQVQAKKKINFHAEFTEQALC